MKVFDFVTGTYRSFHPTNCDREWRKIIYLHNYIANNKWNNIDRLAMQFSIDIIDFKFDFFVSNICNNEIRNRDSTEEEDKLSIVACAVCAEISGRFWDLGRFCAREWFILSRWGSWPFNNAITYQFHANAIPSAFRDSAFPPLPPSTRCNSRALRLDGGQETASCRRRCRRHRTTKENGLG